MINGKAKYCRCRSRICRCFSYKILGKETEKEDVAITLIDRHSYHTMMTELHEVAGGRVEPEAIQYDLQHLFARQKNVQLVTDTVIGIDKERKIVKTKLGSYPFDQLILGMGGEPNDFGTPGVKAHGFTLWSFEDSVRIREHIEKTVAKLHWNQMMNCVKPC